MGVDVGAEALVLRRPEQNEAFLVARGQREAHDAHAVHVVDFCPEGLG